MGLEMGLKKIAEKSPPIANHLLSNANSEKNGQTRCQKSARRPLMSPPLKRRASMAPLRQRPLLLSSIARESAASVSSLPPWEETDAADF